MQDETAAASTTARVPENDPELPSHSNTSGSVEAEIPAGSADYHEAGTGISKGMSSGGENIDSPAMPGGSDAAGVDGSEYGKMADDADELHAGSESEDVSDRNTALSIMQIEDLINRQMADIEKVRDEVKLLKSSYEDIFKNDAKFRELDDKAKEAAKLKKAYQQAMSKDPSVSKAAEDFQRKREELKDLQIGLSDYLREYSRVSGMTQFETPDGRMLEIVQTFKLVKK